MSAVRAVSPIAGIQPAVAPEPRAAEGSTVFGFRGLIAEAGSLAKASRFSRALALLDEPLAAHPNNAELLHARGSTLFLWGRTRESLADFRAAHAAGPQSAGLHVDIAQACHQVGLAEEAERHARQAIVLDATLADAHFGLAAVLQGAQRFDEAVESYERAYALAPSRVEALTYIAACRAGSNDAAATARRAIDATHGDQALAWELLAAALGEDCAREALDAFEHAKTIESRKGEDASTFVIYGHLLRQCGRLAEANALFEENLVSQPHPAGHAHYALALLTAGRYLEGWQQYEFRWSDARMASRRPLFTKPTWNGQDLQAKTVLVWAEQGQGDLIQCLRFAQVLKARGARVVISAWSSVKQLAAAVAGVDEVITKLDKGIEPFDYQIGAMSLPRALQVTLDSIPGAIPYLRTNRDQVARWRARLASAGKLKIGVVWAGSATYQNDRWRSVPASELAALWDTPSVQFFSLQKDRRAGDDEVLPCEDRVVDLAAELHDFRDTAAIIEALDLVIACDTSVAHIVGALGKPCWLLLPANADYRWMRDREDTPWYPSMRLFRQKSLGDWSDVIGRVRAALDEVLARGSSLAPSDLGPPARAQESAKTARPELVEGRAATPVVSQLIDTRLGLTQYWPEGAIGRSLEWYGEWLQPQLDILCRMLPKNAFVLEAGCGIGAHTLALGRMLFPGGGHILGYETDPLFARIVAQNLQFNKLPAGAVTVMRTRLRGLAPFGERTLHAEGRNSTRFDLDNRSKSGTNSACTNAREEWDTIDGLMLARLDLLKVNEPGAWPVILHGAASTLWRLRPLLFIAASDYTAVRDLAARVRDFSYRCWQVETPLFNPANFNCRDNDIFDGAKALAVFAMPEEIGADVMLGDAIELT